MRHLIIIGAGGYGREMFGAALGSVGYGTEFDIRGFLDARSDALAGFQGYPPVIGAPDTYVPQQDDVFISALGNLGFRRKCVGFLESRGGRFVSLVHRTTHLGLNVTVGEGTFIAPYAVLTADVRIGRHSAVFYNAQIGHDAELGDYTHVYASCVLGGSVRLGEGSVVYPGSIVLPRLTIGENAVVGAGSTAISNVRADESVFGCPAVPIR